MKSNEKGAPFPETDLNTLLEIINYVFNILLTERFFPFLLTSQTSIFLHTWGTELYLTIQSCAKSSKLFWFGSFSIHFAPTFHECDW